MSAIALKSPMEIDFNFAGFAETERAIDALPGLLALRVQGDGLIAAARVARTEARKLVPVKSGDLQRTIRARRVSQRVDTASGRKNVPGAAAQVLAGQSGRTTRGRSRTAVIYAAVVEYGLIRNRATAQPYLEPALIGSRTRQLAALAQAMRKSYPKIQRQLAGISPQTRTTRRLATCSGEPLWLQTD